MGTLLTLTRVIPFSLLLVLFIASTVVAGERAVVQNDQDSGAPAFITHEEDNHRDEKSEDSVPPEMIHDDFSPDWEESEDFDDISDEASYCS